MSKHVRGAVLLAVLGLIPVGFSATPASAQLFSRGCKNCQRPVNHCNCQSHQPVVETQMVPQQVTTYRNEVITQYRQEAVAQNVPVTTYRDVVVDEGSYQTVYVPKQVTKRIPQVTYQQQIAYRSVPFQVTRQVPQVSTQMVPRQIVRNQPYSYQTTQVAPITVIGTTVIAVPIVANPVTILPPTSSPASVASNSIPVPDPKFLDSPGAARDTWMTVGSKTGKTSDSGNSIAASSNSGGIRFKPVRTVHRSWESQSRFAAGDSPERQ